MVFNQLDELVQIAFFLQFQSRAKTTGLVQGVLVKRLGSGDAVEAFQKLRHSPPEKWESLRGTSRTCLLGLGDTIRIVLLRSLSVTHTPRRPALMNTPGRILPGGLRPAGRLLGFGRDHKRTGSNAASSAITIRHRISRLNLEHTDPPAGSLTAVQSDLDATCPHSIESLVGPAHVPQALQQPLGQVLQRAEQLHRGSLPLLLGQVPQQAPLFH